MSNVKTPKILYVDIETSPNLGFFWRPGYRVNITHDNIVEERAICCACYKWGHKDKVHTLKWSANKCDKKLLKRLSKVLLEADSIVAHNGDRFDIKWINGKIMYHRLNPLGELPTEDTLKQSRKHFNLNSHRLDYIGKFLQIGEKIHTGGFNLWKRVTWNNDRKALQNMVDYCIGDIILLQNAHEEMLPYIKPKHHVGIMSGGSRNDCPACGHDKVTKNGVYTSRIGRYQKYKCQSCAHIFKDTRQIKK
jgi:hypothetical protein